LRSIEKEDAGEIMSTVRDYVKNNIDPSELEDLNEFEQLRYKYLLEDDFDKLVEVLTFESRTFSRTKVYRKGEHVMFDAADKELFGTSPFHIDEYVRNYPNIKYIQSVEFKEEHMEVRGFSLIPGKDIKNFTDREFSFRIFNSTTREEIPIEHEDVKIGDLNSFGIPFGQRSFNYECAGYKLKIPYELLYDNPDFLGLNRIIVSFKQDGIEYNYFAGAAKYEVRAVSNRNAQIYKDKFFRFSYTFRNELIIEILELENCYEKLSIDEGYLCIHSPQDDGDIFVKYEANSLNDEVYVPFVYDSEKQCYKVELDKLSVSKGRVLFDDGEPVIINYKGYTPFYSDEGQCIVDTSRNYFMTLCMYKDAAEIVNIDHNGGLFEITAEIHSIYGDMKDLKSAVVYFQDKKNYYKRVVDNAEILPDGKFKFKLDLSNDNITHDLYHGYHALYVDYELNGEIHSTTFYLMYDFGEFYKKGRYTYKVYAGQKAQLIVKSRRSWSKLENTPGKRLKHLNFTYKMLRKLPINHKRIIFESMWGAKYSCNPQYLYEYIDKNYPDYECIWAVNDAQFPINGNGVRVRRHSIKYFYYMATSKYFVNNVNFHNHYVKRPGQMEIQTMHGTPLKTIGLDVEKDFPTEDSQKAYIEKCGRWDYITVQSDFVADIASRCYAFGKKFLKYGYPRTDILYTKNNESDITEIKERLGLPLDKKVILYAPTWRIKHKFDLMLDLDSLRESLSDEYVLVFRLHQFSAKGWAQPPEDDFIYDFTRFGSIEELYLISDVLITDYSSVMFDYAILDRPIILFTYDMEEYGEELRGFYVNIEEYAPGPILFTSEEVEDALVNLDRTEEETKELRAEFRKKFLQYERENSSEKVFEDVVLKNYNEGIISKILRKILP
jgi:CDP-glycerol glycerophosphotransferase